MKAPVAFFVFNRPDTTAQVFAEIRRAQPQKLLLVADGPRECRPGEAEKCAQVRAIVEQVDWPCEVQKNYSDVNLGCKIKISSGLDWVFEQVEEAIILEDDCLPDKSFFNFCESLLDLYRNDERVMHIGGVNFQGGLIRGDGSYYFSRLYHIWGWATWRRAWKFYDVSMNSFPRFRSYEYIKNIFSDKSMQKKCLLNFESVYQNRIDTWDYQWTFALYQQNGLAIIPNVNLVSNIGFRNDATHTLDADNIFADMPSASIEQIIHPIFVVPDLTADAYTYKLNTRFSLQRLFSKCTKKLKSLLILDSHG